MTTGRGSKRNEQTTIALDDTDDDDDNDQPRQPASRNIANKRRRTILEDDDSDEVEVIFPTRAGNNSNSRSTTATRSTRSSRHSTSDDHVLHATDVSVSDPSFTRCRSNRSSQASHQEGNEEDNYSKSKDQSLSTNQEKSTRGTTKKSMSNGNEVDDTGALKIPRKSVTTNANHDDGNGNTVAGGKSNSIIQNAESLLTLTPTKMSPIRNPREQQQSRSNNQGSTATPVKTEREGMSQNSTGTSSQSSSTELSKQEKLQKFLELRQLKTNEPPLLSHNNTTLSSVSVPASAMSTQAKKLKQLDTRAIQQDLRTICNQLKRRGGVNDDGSSSLPNIGLDIQLSSRGRVDLFGSFICTDENDTRQLDVARYDFFDTNQQGKIVVSSPQPMYPDEFPNHTPTHNAAWWGIVEPTLGVGKYKRQIPISQPLSAVPPPPPAPASNIAPTVTGVMQDHRNGNNNNHNRNDGIVTNGIDVSKGRGRDNETSNEMKMGYRNERGRQPYSNDRIPTTNDARHLDHRNQRPVNYRNSSNSQEASSSSSRHHGRR